MNREEFSELAWADFVRFCFNSQEMRKEFTDKTGSSLFKPKSPIDRMIDDCTGSSEEEMFLFVKFVTERYFGLEYAPRSFRKKCKELCDKNKGRGK